MASKGAARRFAKKLIAATSIESKSVGHFGDMMTELGDGSYRAGLNHLQAKPAKIQKHTMRGHNG